MSFPGNAQLCSKRNTIKITFGIQTCNYLGLIISQKVPQSNY